MPGKFVVTKGKDGQSYFTLKAANSQVVLSSEGYKTAKACINGIESTRKNSQNPNRFEVRTAKDVRQYFILKATNCRESGCQNGMKSVAASAADAVVVDESA